MQQLKSMHGPLKVKAAVRVLRTRLSGRPETEGLFQRITEAFRRLGEKIEAEEEAQAEKMAATNRLKYADGKLDQAVRVLEASGLALVGRDRADRRYQKQWGRMPMSELVMLPYEQQVVEVKRLLAALTDAELEPLAVHQGPLKDGVAAVEQTLAERNARAAEAATAAAELDLAAEEARRAYNRAYPALQTLFPDDPALVESFFPALRAARKSAAEEPEADPEA